ncbi:MAG TPA: recombinase [bacterium]|nr:recombinase [bacterium]
MNQDNYEKKSKKIRAENKKLLEEFVIYLKSLGMKKAMAEKHKFNAEFFINEFLLYYDAVEAKNGAEKIHEFLGEWFPRKAMWADKKSIKENAESIRKFYRFLCYEKKLPQTRLLLLENTIDDNMDEWLGINFLDDSYDEEDKDENNHGMSDEKIDKYIDEMIKKHSLPEPIHLDAFRKKKKSKA